MIPTRKQLRKARYVRRQLTWAFWDLCTAEDHLAKIRKKFAGGICVSCSDIQGEINIAQEYILKAKREIDPLKFVKEKK